MPKHRRIVVGITGASGFVYGVYALRMLKALEIETHLIVSKAAQLTRSHETDFSYKQVAQFADAVYRPDDIGAPISSGSFKTLGMLVAPCSVRTLSEISSGVTSSLLSRAADVCLKERRRVVLMLRETPLHAGHIRSMLAVSEMGAIVFPPVPAFYQRPVSIHDVVAHSVARALDLFDLEVPDTPRWGEEMRAENASARKDATPVS